jgi:chromosome segregation ATPase
MSGLIWGALGKSLADTGSMIGGMYARQGEQEALAAREDARTRALSEREDQRSANALKNQESMIDYREQKAKAADEALQQRVIKERAAAQAAPEDTSKVMGDYGLVRNANTRLQETNESLENARSAGAHSTTIKGFESDLKELQVQRAAILKEISEQNRETENAKRHEETGKRLDILAKNATTAETRASKDTSKRDQRETTMDLDRKLKSAKDDLAEHLGVNTTNVNEELSRLKKRAESDPVSKAKLEAAKDAIDAVSTARTRLNSWEAKGPSIAAPAASSSTSLPEPQSPAEVAKLKPGTRFKAPDGSIRYR